MEVQSPSVNVNLRQQMGCSQPVWMHYRSASVHGPRCWEAGDEPIGDRRRSRASGLRSQSSWKPAPSLLFSTSYPESTKVADNERLSSLNGQDAQPFAPFDSRKSVRSKSSLALRRSSTQPGLAICLISLVNLGLQTLSRAACKRE